MGNIKNGLHSALDAVHPEHLTELVHLIEDIVSSDNPAKAIAVARAAVAVNREPEIDLHDSDFPDEE